VQLLKGEIAEKRNLLAAVQKRQAEIMAEREQAADQKKAAAGGSGGAKGDAADASAAADDGGSVGSGGGAADKLSLTAIKNRAMVVAIPDAELEAMYDACHAVCHVTSCDDFRR
jgi:hypothetical protein